MARLARADSGAGMITMRRICREWPHHVAAVAGKVSGENYEIVRGFTGLLSVASCVAQLTFPGNALMLLARALDPILVFATIVR
jgi:hypothetical protein